jgi:hypothetical protein
VAGRALVWSDERVRAAAAGFVAATDETWRLQRGNDAECRHFQAMADQGHYGQPREKGAPRDAGTRQGIYACAPSGALLASINALDADAVLAVLEQARVAWEALPDEQRWLAAGADLRPAHRWEWSCPTDGLVLARTVRELPPDGDPDAEPLRPSNRDYAWFSADEARLLLPATLEPGARRDVPPLVVRRLARFHLVDNVRGQTLPFADEEVAADSWLASEVVGREGDGVVLRLRGATRAVAEGPWLMGDNAWTPGGEYPRGVSCTLEGRAVWDPSGRTFTAFELVGVGEFWGSGWLNNRRADDRGPIGFLFTLAPDTPAGRVPPAFVNIYDAPWIVRPGTP